MFLVKGRTGATPAPARPDGPGGHAPPAAGDGRRVNAPALLLAGCLLALVDAYALGVPSDYGRAIDAFTAVVALTLGVLATRGRLTLPPTVVVPAACAVLVAFQVTQLNRAVSVYGSGPWLTVAKDTAYVLPTVGLLVVAAHGRLARAAWYCLLAAFLLGSVALLVASPRPDIDVWYLAQHASRCIAHGCDPYSMFTPQSPEVKTGFSYLPGAALVATPFYLVFGETRYAEIAALALSAVMLAGVAPGRAGRLAGALILCVPGTLVGIEVAWNDPLLLVGLVGVAWAWRRRSSPGIVAFLIVAFTVKQYAVLLAPLVVMMFGWRRAIAAAIGSAAVILPWVLASPSAFYRTAVRLFFVWPPRPDSLTLWARLPTMVRGWLPFAAVAVLYLLLHRVLPRSPGGWLLGSGGVLATFDLLNKFSFYNEWALAAMLLIAGAACSWGAPTSAPFSRAGRNLRAGGAREGTQRTAEP